MRTGRQRMIHSRDRPSKKNTIMSLGLMHASPSFRPGRQKPCLIASADSQMIVVLEKATLRDPAMQLRRDEFGLLSQNGKLLSKSCQGLFHVLMLNQEGAEQNYWRNDVTICFSRLSLILHRTWLP
jgi:hypothetical protein